MTMKGKKRQLKQISFRLYDTPRDRRINDFLEFLGENQSEYLKRLVEQQIGAVPSEKVPKALYGEIAEKQPDSDEKIDEKSQKRLSAGFKGFRM